MDGNKVWRNSCLILLFMTIFLHTSAQHYECAKILNYNISEIILENDEYIVSYNIMHNNPNWVGWHLTPNRIYGTFDRTDNFTKDKQLPKQYRVASSEYTYSGYDRGHMCPAADNKWLKSAMIQSFLMTNICPQIPELNRIWWEHLEDACRRWSHYCDLYIICGPIYNNDNPNTIGRTMYIDVPDAFFKVVLDLTHMQTLGFYYKNDSSRQTIDEAVCTVDSIEQITGYDFFSDLPDEIENKIEAITNIQYW